MCNYQELLKRVSFFPVLLSIALALVSAVFSHAGVTKAVHLGYCAYDDITDEAVQWYAQHADLVITHEWQNDRLKALRSLNQGITILLYKISLNKTNDAHGAHGYEGVNQNHPEWFLLDKNGSRMTGQDSEYSRLNVYWLDWGNQGWRDYWCNSVFNDATSQGWGGVFMDCAFVDIKNYWAPNGILTYATNSAFNNSMENFISGCYTQFQAAGKLLVPNSVDCVYYDGYWESRLAHCHGGLEEGFVNICQWRPELIWVIEERWERQISALEHTGEQNKLYFAMAQNRGLNRQDTLYNIASYLMGKKNDKAFFFNEGVDGNVYSNFVTDYNTFKDIYTAPIGVPTGARYKQDNLWQRNFTGGRVLVNPTYSSYTASLDKNYKKLDGTVAASVTLNGHEGIILLLDTTPPATPTGLKTSPRPGAPVDDIKK